MLYNENVDPTREQETQPTSSTDKAFHLYADAAQLAWQWRYRDLPADQKEELKKIAAQKEEEFGEATGTFLGAPRITLTSENLLLFVASAKAIIEIIEHEMGTDFSDEDFEMASAKYMRKIPFDEEPPDPPFVQDLLRRTHRIEGDISAKKPDPAYDPEKDPRAPEKWKMARKALVTLGEIPGAISLKKSLEKIEVGRKAQAKTTKTKAS